MQKEIEIIFHVGLGKTGTTFLQKSLENTKDVLFLGKYTNASKENSFKGFDKRIGQFHHSLFRKTLRSEAVKAFSNPSRTSSLLIDQYSSALKDLIIDSSKKKIVISDECIGDYVNYMGEWNIFLNCTRHKLKKLCKTNEFKLKTSISFTIRNQEDIIKSYFGYTSTLNDNIDEFISYGLDRPHLGWFGGLFYATNIEMIKTLAGDSWQVYVAPYELIGQKDDQNAYLERAFGKLNFETASIDSRINSNSEIIDDQKFIKIKPRNLLRRVGFRLIHENAQSRHEAIRRKYTISRFVYGILHLYGDYLNRIGIFIASIQSRFIKKDNYVTPSLMSIKKIKNTYRDDNAKLVQLLSKEELILYGYIDE